MAFYDCLRDSYSLQVIRCSLRRNCQLQERPESRSINFERDIKCILYEFMTELLICSIDEYTIFHHGVFGSFLYSYL